MFPERLSLTNTATGRKMALADLKTRRVRAEAIAVHNGWQSAESPTWSDIDLLLSLLGEKTGLITMWDTEDKK